MARVRMRDLSGARKNVPVSASGLSRINRELIRMRDTYPQTNLSARFSLSGAFLVDTVIAAFWFMRRRRRPNIDA
jgi:hypothetical protein